MKEMTSTFRLATAVVLLLILQLARASLLDFHGHRLSHPWSMVPDWFDRTLQPLNAHLLDSDPFHDAFFDWDLSDELPFPSIHPAFLTAHTLKPTQLADKLKFYIDAQGFRPEDLTMRLQGQDLVVEGEKATCSLSTCYKHRYSIKRRLPMDVDLDTIRAKLTDRGELQIEADRLERNRRERRNARHIKLPMRNNDGCPLLQRKTEKTANNCRGYDMRKRPVKEFHETVSQSMCKRQRKDDSHGKFQENFIQRHESTHYAKETEEINEVGNMNVDNDDETTIEVLPDEN